MANRFAAFTYKEFAYGHHLEQVAKSNRLLRLLSEGDDVIITATNGAILSGVVDEMWTGGHICVNVRTPDGELYEMEAHSWIQDIVRNGTLLV